jgi:hypothetical protein
VRVCLGLRAEKKGWKAWGNDEAQSEEPELEGGPAEVCVGGGGLTCRTRIHELWDPWLLGACVLRVCP